jgi:hypothetical protein
MEDAIYRPALALLLPVALMGRRDAATKVEIFTVDQAVTNPSFQPRVVMKERPCLGPLLCPYPAFGSRTQASECIGARSADCRQRRGGAKRPRSYAVNCENSAHEPSANQ